MSLNFKQIIFWLAIACLLTPFLVNTNTYFPFIITKATVFRALVEIMLVFWVAYQLFGKEPRKHQAKNPLLWAVLIFSIIILLSAIFGVNFEWSFFSGNERMEGVFGIWHFVLFFVILLTTFDQNDIEKLLKAQVYISLLYALVALMAYRGAGQVTSAMTSNRLAGYTGNPSYYALYALFNGFLALYFYFQQYRSDKKLFNYWFIIFLVEILLMVITGCRGTVVGFVAATFFIGLLLLIKGQDSDKQLKKIVLLGFIIIASIFVLLYSFKNVNFIKNNFVLNRLTSFSLTDPTTFSRLMSAKTAFHAFLEKPIFGWGIENYQTAYVKYFNPDVIKYLPGDFFFDRAHNKPMEVLATTGILGFLSYLAIFAAAFYLIYKKQKQDSNWFLPGLAIFGALIAYFVQNIFIFDFHESYLMFFLVLGFISSLSINVIPGFKESVIPAKAGIRDSRLHGNDKAQDFSQVMFKYFAIIATSCLVIYTLSFWVIKPYLVSQKIIRVMKLIVQGKGDDAYNLTRQIFLSPSFLRNDTITGLDKILASYHQKIDNESAQKITELIITNAEISLAQHPNYMILLNKADLEMFSLSWNEEGLANAKKSLEQAINLAPSFPQPRYNYIKILLMEKNYEEAEKQAQYVLSLNDSLPEPYYFLSLIYSEQKNNEKSLEYLIKSLELGLQINSKDLINSLVSKLVTLKRYDLIEKLYLQAISLDPKDANLYVYLAATYGKMHNKAKAIEYAQKAAEINSNYKQAAEEFIKIIENEEWDKIPDSL
ncbi:MAG: tetratricopeptide repeat protein [Parcubacteria group bacterium]|nr:tetratricopeptide repeat protein [Parcubacteria group bacterium]